jgi:hypothetical protein
LELEKGAKIEKKPSVGTGWPEGDAEINLLTVQLAA